MSSVAQSYPVPASSGELHSADVLAFAIPFLQFVQFNVVGILYASELLLVATFIYLAVCRKLRLSTPVSMRFVALCTAWLISQVVTDFIRHSAFADYARGWSKIAMTLIAFTVFYALLYGRERRLVIYGWGLVVGCTLGFFISPGQWAKAYPWKFGMSYPVTLGVVLLACRKNFGKSWPVIITAIIGTINIAAGARSQGGVCLAVALYLLFARPEPRKADGISTLKKGYTVAFVVLCGLSVLAILWTYRYAARSGLLGYEAQENYEQQSAGDYGVLLGGRSAILGSIPAIYDSPILGHGSWARDPIYVFAQLQAMAAMGYENTSAIEEEELEEGYIPAHSFLFGAWVEAGIVGAILWVWVLVLAVRCLVKTYTSDTMLLPMVAFCGLSLVWNLLFSPYGAEQRIIVPFYLVVIMTQVGLKPLQLSTPTPAPLP